MPGRERGGRRRYVLVLLVLTSVTLITLDQRNGDSGPIGGMGRFAHRVVAPVSDSAASVMRPISDWFDGVLHAGSLKRDNADLRRKLAAARIDAQRNAQAQKEYKILAALDGQVFLDAIPSKVARVVAFAPGNFERSITLDRGTEARIKRGMPVVAADGLVGRVVQVWKGGSKVKLLDDPEFAVGVRMVRERIVGVAEGQAGRSTMTVHFDGPLKPADRPRPGDLAETSGLQGSTFPPGIPVGTVQSVTVSDDGLSIDVRLVPLADVADLEYVKVLLWRVGSPVPAALLATTTSTTTITTTTTTTTAPGNTTGTSTSTSTPAPTSTATPTSGAVTTSTSVP